MKLVKIYGYNPAIMRSIGITTDSWHAALEYLNELLRDAHDGIKNAHSGAWNYISSVSIRGGRHKISRANYKRCLPSIKEAISIIETAKNLEK